MTKLGEMTVRYMCTVLPNKKKSKKSIFLISKLNSGVILTYESCSGAATLGTISVNADPDLTDNYNLIIDCRFTCLEVDPKYGLAQIV